jgi:hypothetical protein
LQQVVAAAAIRWTIETLFADFKELMGADHYQVRSAQAILRYWALGLVFYQYLDEQRVRLAAERGRHVTMGEARTWVHQQHHDLLLDWIIDHAASGVATDQIRQRLKPALA